MIFRFHPEDDRGTRILEGLLQKFTEAQEGNVMHQGKV